MEVRLNISFTVCIEFGGFLGGILKINLEIRIAKYYLCVMKSEKRISRSYKATDLDYKAAMKRAKKEKVPLAVLVEEVVSAYGEGAFTVHFTKPEQAATEKLKQSKK